MRVTRSFMVVIDDDRPLDDVDADGLKERIYEGFGWRPSVTVKVTEVTPLLAETVRKMLEP